MNTFSYYILVDSNHFHFRKKISSFKQGTIFVDGIMSNEKKNGICEKGEAEDK